MGFFKRILSLGSKSKKSKRKQQNMIASTRVDAEGRIITEKSGQDPDSSANRLLRSSSTKFSVMSAIDYTSLPPMPHSAQDLLSTPSLSPSASTATAPNTPGGLQRNGTYVVKVHGRTTHSRTEFPQANPPASPTKSRRKQPPKTPERNRRDSVDEEEELKPEPRLKEVNFTPKDTSRIYNLRRDPSVVSLLNLYDDQGCLDSKVFDDSPPTPASAEGREPTKRTGSTLRKLLGEPEPHFALNDTAEGDISWAERFLDEQLGNDSPSPPSSLDLETPKDALFPDALSVPHVAAVDTTFSSLDPDISINYPAISSMEVEVSGSDEDIMPVVKAVPVSETLLPDPKTPQRASEVFGFLSRRNTLTVSERDLPPLPQIITPECTGSGQQLSDDDDLNLKLSDTSLGEPYDATHSANTSHSTQLTSSDTNSHASHAQIQTATMTKLSSAFAASTTSLNLLISQDTTKATKEMPLPDEVPANHTTSTSASTARATTHQTGSSLASSSSTKLGPSKIPRGPRPRPPSMCERDVPAPASTLPPSRQNSDDDNDDPAPAALRHDRAPKIKREALTNIPRRQHRRVTSRSSGCDVDPDLNPDPLNDDFHCGPAVPQRKRSTKPADTSHTQWHAHSKENSPSPPRSRGLSSIPMFGQPMVTPPTRHHRALQQLQEPPSPASSSELSPVAREMMSDLRQQRMRARQVERRRGVWVRE